MKLLYSILLILNCFGWNSGAVEFGTGGFAKTEDWTDEEFDALLPDTLYEEYTHLSAEEQSVKCDEIGGVLYKGVCYTFDSMVHALTLSETDPAEARADILASECPGNCAIWGVTCAPETW